MSTTMTVTDVYGKPISVEDLEGWFNILAAGERNHDDKRIYDSDGSPRYHFRRNKDLQRWKFVNPDEDKYVLDLALRRHGNEKLLNELF